MCSFVVNIRSLLLIKTHGRAEVRTYVQEEYIIVLSAFLCVCLLDRGKIKTKQPYGHILCHYEATNKRQKKTRTREKMHLRHYNCCYYCIILLLILLLLLLLLLCGNCQQIYNWTNAILTDFNDNNAKSSNSSKVIGFCVCVCVCVSGLKLPITLVAWKAG